MVKVLFGCLVSIISLIAYSGPTQDLRAAQTKFLDEGLFRFDIEANHSINKKENSNLSYSEVGLTYGIFQGEKLSMEFGVDWREPIGNSFSDGILLNTKLVYQDIRRDKWSLAVGVDSLGFQSAVSDFNILYGVADIYFVQEYYMTVGGYAGGNALINSVGDKDNIGFIIGFYKTIQSGYGTYNFQYISGFNDYGGMYAGANFQIAKGINGTIAASLPNDTGLQMRVILKLAVVY